MKSQNLIDTLQKEKLELNNKLEIVYKNIFLLIY